jgi:hypothetical protein
LQIIDCFRTLIYSDIQKKGLPDTDSINYLSLLIINIFLYIGVALMKKLFIFSLFILLSASCTLLSFSGNGSGTEEDPFQITNVHQLQEMKDELDAHYILMNDIDASETREWNVGDHDGDPNTPDQAMGFEPVGKFEMENPTNGFAGSFDGQGHLISGIYINRPLEIGVGLFGYIHSSCYIKNLSIENIYIQGYRTVGGLVGIIATTTENSSINISGCNITGELYGDINIGALCGYSATDAEGSTIKISETHSDIKITGYNSDIGGIIGSNIAKNGNVSIQNCTASCDITGDNYIGGICGTNNSQSGEITIQSCSSRGKISGSSFVGGLCGFNFCQNNKITIHDCFSNFEITGTVNVGGFCGFNQAQSNTILITKCFSQSNIVGLSNVGGFVGQNYSIFQNTTSKAEITECFSTGSVNANNASVGGFCGTNNSEVSAVINNCFTTVTITSKWAMGAGGFCGLNNGDHSTQISNCYSAGEIISDRHPGGFVGFSNTGNPDHIVNSYWDTELSNIDESEGGEGKTTAEMMMQSTFENWDFDNVWCMVEGKTYPQLQYFVDCDTLVSVPTIESNEGLEIYPNPATSQITLSLGEEFVSAPEIDIIDYLGNVIRCTTSSRCRTSDKNITINTSSLSPGVYLLRIRSGEILEVRKFVVL